jgi:hypothetical protein
MAKNDYFVIVYRLLKYLYGCLKESKQPDREVLDAAYFGIGQDYWEYIIRTLYKEGYIEGIVLVPLIGQTEPGIKFVNIRITPSGIQYLSENSMFKKVKEAIHDVADIL